MSNIMTPERIARFENTNMSSGISVQQVRPRRDVNHTSVKPFGSDNFEVTRHQGYPRYALKSNSW